MVEDAAAARKKAAIEALLFSPTPSEEQAQASARRTSEADLAALQASFGAARESRPRSTARSRRRSQARQRSLSRSRVDPATILASKAALARDVEALEEGPRRRRERLVTRPARTPSPLDAHARSESPARAAPADPEQRPDGALSVVLIGGPGSGKTVACRTYARGVSELRPAPTLGVEAYAAPAPRGLKLKSVKLWDTSGDARFATQTDQLVKVADAVLVLYACQSGFADAHDRLLRACQESPPHAIVVLVATTLKKRITDDVEATELALAAGADFRTLQCADRQQVAALFRDVLQAAGEKRRLVRGPAHDDSTLRSARAREVLGYGVGFLVLVGVILKN